MDKQFSDYLEHTHIHVANSFDKESAEYAGSKAVKDLMFKELTKFGFTDIKIDHEEYTERELAAYANAIGNKKIYITVHYVAQSLRLDNHVPVTRPLRYRPELSISNFVDNGKPAPFHIQIIGGINTGKTTLVNMLRKVLYVINPTAEVIAVDSDPYSFNFYYGDDAERVGYFTNLKHRKINLCTPMLHNVMA